MKRSKTKRDEAQTIVSVQVPRPFAELLRLIAERTDLTVSQMGRRGLKLVAAEEASKAGLAAEAKAAGLELTAA